MSNEHNPKASSVRFAEDTKKGDDDAKNEPKRSAKQKQPPQRPNAYEEDDDIDDAWEDDDDDDPDVYSKEIQQVQKKRRYHNADDDDDELNASTDINATTSLAAEGIPVEPFHMKQEESDGTGFFDGDTYIFRRGGGDQEEPDAWLDSLQDNDKDANAESSSATTVPRPVKTREIAENMDAMEPTELYARMIPLVSESETVLKAIARYGNAMKRTRKGETNQMAHDALNLLTGAANSLLLRGQVDIYEKTPTDLLQMLPSSSSSEEEKQQQEVSPSNSNTPTVQWEYQGRQDGKIHGPYSTADMLSWIRAGYFVGDSAVNVRTLQKKVKSMQEDLMDDLLDDDDDDKEDDTDAYERGEWIRSDQVNFVKYH